MRPKAYDREMNELRRVLHARGNLALAQVFRCTMAGLEWMPPDIRHGWITALNDAIPGSGLAQFKNL